MSIVATMMFPNGGVVMYGDKRAVKKINNEIIIMNDFVKIHKVTEKIGCGITGHAEWGLFLLKKLTDLDFQTIESMIEYIKSFPTSEFIGSTVTIAGIYDNEKPFIWTYRSTGETSFDQDYISYSVATEPQELGESCGKFLEKKFEETNDPHRTLQDVIKFASLQNPHYISDLYDFVVIPFKR